MTFSLISRYFKKDLINNFFNLSFIIGLLIGLLILICSYYFKINQYGIGFAIFFGSLSYRLLFYSTKKLNYDIYFIEINSIQKKLLNIFYFFIYIISILIIYFDQYHRPLIYFIFISLLAALITVDIYSKNKEEQSLIIFKIILLALNLRYGLFFEFNGLSGGDIWTHVKMISNSLNAGAITPTSMEFSKYFYYPILHILISILYSVANINIKMSIFYSIIIINILTSLILIKIGQLVGHKKTSLVAILIYLVSDIPILKTTLHIEPITIIIIYFCLILWLFIQQKKIEYIILIIILYVSMILTHQLGALISLYILIIILFSYSLYDFFLSNKSEKNKSSKFYILSFMIIILILYWQYSYVSYGSKISFFEFVIQPFQNLFKYGLESNLDSLAYIKVLNSYDFISNFLFQIGYFILLFLLVIGILYWLNTISPHKFVIISAILGLYLCIWGLPLTKISNSGMFTRWFIFPYIFMIFPASDAILLISSKLYLKFKKKWVIKFIPMIIITILCFTMITTPYINADSPIHSPERWPRSMFKDSELIAVDMISQIYSNDIITDGFYPVAFTMSSFPGDFRTIELDSKEQTEYALLLRTCANYEPIGIKAYGYEIGITKVIGPSYFIYSNNNPNLNCIYNNNGIIFYVH